MAEYPSDVVILDKSAIAKLSDDQLIDTYENTRRGNSGQPFFSRHIRFQPQRI